jgi:hypothetical protein
LPKGLLRTGSAASDSDEQLALAAAIRKAIGRDEVARAEAMFVELCCNRTWECQALRHLVIYALEPPRRETWGRIFAPILFEAMGEDGCDRACDELWVRCALALGEKPRHLWRQIVDMIQTDRRRGCAAAIGYMWYLFYEDTPRELWKYIRRHRRLFTGIHELWDAAGSALCMCLADLQNVKWHRGWEQRDDVTPGNMTSLVASLRRLRRMDEAREVSLRALQLPRSDGWNHQVTCLAADDMERGDLDSLERRLNETAGFCVNDYSLAQNQVMLEYHRFFRRTQRTPEDVEASLRKLDEIEESFRPAGILCCVALRRLFDAAREAMRLNRPGGKAGARPAS